MMDTQNSTLRIHTPHSGFPHSNTLSFESGVLSIRHKSGARSPCVTDADASKRALQVFTDDTAMARSVAASLIERRGLGVEHMARRYNSTRIMLLLRTPRNIPKMVTFVDFTYTFKENGLLIDS